MVPFMEFVHQDTGRKHRVPWDRDRATVKMEEFRSEAKEFYRQQDIRKAQAMGIAIADDAVGLATLVDGPDNSFQIDPIAAKIKHSGAEFNDRWIPRWQEFCSRPQNDEGAEYPVVTYTPRTSSVQAEPVIGVTTTTEKRRAGRPRKTEMADV